MADQEGVDVTDDGAPNEGGGDALLEAPAPPVAPPLALYRRYRPDTFAEVIGQEHVTEPLQRALVNNRVNHAYLFSGPRGCGKTTSARILARALNCEKAPVAEPCGECRSCRDLATGGPGSIDVIEIDAASHGGVDDARDLRERAFFAPVSSRYKIYIVDEAHMVTTAGFNALLKLVEEPPPHVKFIFATTEPDKVIGTIRSRTHHYPFRLVPPRVLSDYLGKLCTAEGIEVENGVLPLVVRAGAGSVRDSLSVLDQLLGAAAEQGVSYGQAAALLGYTPDSLLDEMLDAFAAGDSGGVFRCVDKVIEVGQDPRRFAEDLLRRIRDLVIVAAVPDALTSGLVDVADDQAERFSSQAAALGAGELTRAGEVIAAGLTEMRGTTAPRLHLELMCARVLLPGTDLDDRGVHARLDRLERRIGMTSTGATQGQSPTPGDSGQQLGTAATPSAAPGEAMASVAGEAMAEPGRGTATQQQTSAARSDAPTPIDAVSPPTEPATTHTGSSAADDGSVRSPAVAPAPGEVAGQPHDRADGGASTSAGTGSPTDNGPAAAAGTQGAPGQGGVDDWPTPVTPGSQRDSGSQGAAGPAGPGPAGAAPAPDRSQESRSEQGAPSQSGSSPAGPGQGSTLSITDLRRLWPEVLEEVKSRRRFTWILLSQNAHVADLTNGTMVLAMPNAGARENFARGGSEDILREALIAVLGANLRIDTMVDPSAGAAGGRAGQPSGGSARSSGPAPGADAGGSGSASSQGGPSPSGFDQPGSGQPEPGRAGSDQARAAQPGPGQPGSGQPGSGQPDWGPGGAGPGAAAGPGGVGPGGGEGARPSTGAAGVDQAAPAAGRPTPGTGPHDPWAPVGDPGQTGPMPTPSFGAPSGNPTYSGDVGATGAGPGGRPARSGGDDPPPWQVGPPSDSATGPDDWDARDAVADRDDDTLDEAGESHTELLQRRLGAEIIAEEETGA